MTERLTRTLIIAAAIVAAALLLSRWTPVDLPDIVEINVTDSHLLDMTNGRAW